jgi:hypothetical protein
LAIWKRPRRCSLAPGEGALPEAEELGLEQLLRDRRAVHRHERPLAARAREVDGAGQQLLPHPGLAVDENGGVEIHHRLHELEHPLHGGALGHDVLEGETLLVAADGQAARGLELLELDGAADDEEQLGHLEGLDQVVLGPEPHRPHRRLDGAVGGHHHHREVGVVGLHAPHQLHAVHARQPLVGEDHVHVLHLEGVERFLRAGRRQHVVAGQLQRPVQRAQEHVVVLDQQDLPLHESPPVAMEWTAAAGRAMRTRVPRPGALSTAMSPPCRSMIFLTMDMPSPVPDGLVV